MCFIAVGGVFEASVSGKSSKVILRHTAAGYSCGYGFSYQLWGGAGLRLMVGEGGGVIWEDQGDTGAVWKRVRHSQQGNVTTCIYISARCAAHMYVTLLCLPHNAWSSR